MGTLFFDIVVVPSSGKQMITLDKQGRLKIFLKNAPEKGKANQELIRFLSEKSGLPQKQLTITKGLTDRKKRIAVATDISFVLLLHNLNIDQQTTLL
jgi:uncharacterized protein